MHKAELVSFCGWDKPLFSGNILPITGSDERVIRFEFLARYRGGRAFSFCYLFAAAYLLSVPDRDPLHI
jgi:hypothetical protein